MKAILSVFLLFMGLTVHAEDSILKICYSGDERAEVLIEQMGTDASMRIQELARRYSSRQSSGLNITVQEGVSYMVKHVRIADLVTNKAMLYEMMGIGLIQLKAFDGDQGMIHHYVKKYAGSLQCN